MNNINGLTGHLLTNSKQQAEEILQKARSEAEHIIHHAIKRGVKEKQEILKTYHKRAKAMEAANDLNLSMEEQRAVLLTKQALIDEVLKRVHVRFENQKVEEWIGYIKKLLVEVEIGIGEEKPVICVPKEYYEKAKEEFSGEYEVVVSPIRSGFILSYKTYDLNYEVEHFLHYQREEMEVLISDLLFSGEHHG